MNAIRSILLPAFIAAAVAPALATENPNVLRVRDYWRQVWSEGNLQAVEEFYDPACKQGDDFTIEAFQRNVIRQRESFPDFSVEVHEVFAHDNWVATRVTYRGTHTGRKMFGQEAMTKPVEVPGIDIFIFKDDKCVEHLHVADHLELALQIGVKLAPTTRAAVDAPPDS
jgi:predicted ester cyclase